MSRSRRLWPAWLLVALAPMTHADETKTPPQKPPASPPSTASKATPASGADDELLEFLGSVGEESDGEWMEFLSKTEISKTTKAKDKAPAATEVSKK